METESKKKVLRYQCAVQGIFGRNRKIKHESFKIGESTPEAPLTAEALLPAFRAKLAEIKFKGGVARIVEEPVTVTTYTGGERTYTTESYMLFSGRTLHREQVEGAGVKFTATGGAGM